MKCTDLHRPRARKKHWIHAALLGLLILAGLGHANTAEARRGVPFLFTGGDQIFEVADLPDELQMPRGTPYGTNRRNTRLANWKLGYKCDQVGLFWASIWTSDCELVAFDGDNTYADLPPASKAKYEKEYAVGDSKRGVWNRFGIVFVGLGVLGIGALRFQ